MASIDGRMKIIAMSETHNPESLPALQLSPEAESGRLG
jgi:hypothetical protein